MKNIIKCIAVWLVVTMTVSHHSCNFLNVDDYFEESLKYDSIFTSFRNIDRYLWATAALFPDEGNFTNTLGSFASDEAFSVHPTQYAGMEFTLGNITPTNVGTIGTRWNTMYIIIRRANTIIENLRVEPPRDMTTIDIQGVLGYAYFMRAYAYYNLLMQYGPIVIVGDAPMDTNEEMDYYDLPRSTFDVSVDYVCDEFERAARFLPLEVPSTFFGRPTKGAAWGLIARLRLIQASPLWNGGSAAVRTFGTWTRSTDDVHYVSQTYDERKWAVAALAAWRIIETNYFELHTVERMIDTPPLPTTTAALLAGDYPDGAGNIDPFRSYSDMFTGEALAARNREYLWARNSASLTSFTQHSFPVRDFNGLGTISIPQKVIDAYRMVDGQTIETASDEYPYRTTGVMGGSNRLFSGYRLNNSVHNMYVDREVRFYANIGFNRAFWFCYSTGGSFKEREFTYFADGNAGRGSVFELPNNYNISGYTVRKYIHVDDSWGTWGNAGADGARRVQKVYSIIRYAEILLSYVEALNNLTTSHTVQDADGNSYTFSRDVAQMKQYYDLVRFRAGIPGPTDTELASQQIMQELLERERMVEFFMENIRFYDVRRWGIYERTENEPILGMNTEASEASGAFYNIVPINHSRIRSREMDRRLILFPIDLNEVRKSPSMDQNPGYQQ